MILLPDIIKILRLPHGDGGLGRAVVMRDCCRVAPPLINRDLFRTPVRTNRLGQKGRGGGFIAVRCQQKIKGLSLSVHGARHIFPLALDADVRLIHPPALPYRALPQAELLLELRRLLEDPAGERGMVDGDAPFAPHFLQLPIRHRGCNVPAYAPQNNCFLEMAALEIHRRTSTPQEQSTGYRNEHLKDTHRFATEPAIQHETLKVRRVKKEGTRSELPS
jgi:hypothetical protein